MRRKNGWKNSRRTERSKCRDCIPKPWRYSVFVLRGDEYIGQWDEIMARKAALGFRKLNPVDGGANRMFGTKDKCGKNPAVATRLFE